VSTSHHSWDSPRTRRSLLRQAGAAGATLAGSSLLAACGGGGGGTSGGGGHATIEFWDMQWGTDRYEQTARSLVAAYEKANPNVTVRYRLIPWTSFYETFSTAVASGTTPDVSTGAAFQGFQYDQAIASVDSAVARWKTDGTADDVIQAAVDAQVDDRGKQTGLPWCMDARPLSYNRRLFDAAGIKPPTTWDELRDAARELTGSGRYGIGFCGQGALAAQQLIALMFNNDGGLYDQSCGPDLINDRNAEVCEFVQQLVRDGSIPKAGVGWTNTDIANAMGRGEIAMVFGEPAMFNTLPNGDDIDIASPLTGPHGDRGAALWYVAMWMYESAKDKPATLDFMSWWLANEQPIWSRGGATQLPVRRSFYRTVPNLQDPRYQKVLDEWVPIGRTLGSPCPHSSAVLNQVEGQAFLPTLAQEVLSLKPVEPALKTANDALGALKA